MALEDIKSLQVPTAKDCVLFLWATSPLLPEALEVMQAWGFEYKTSLVWVKTGRWGLGYYVRSQHELVLIGRKGNPRLPLNASRPPSVFEAERGKQHDALEQTIEAMYPAQRMLKMFFTSLRSGWDGFGAPDGKQVRSVTASGQLAVQSIPGVISIPSWGR